MKVNFIVYSLHILYILKALIFIFIFFGNIKSGYDENLLIIRNEGNINSSDYYKGKADKKKSLKNARIFFKKCDKDILINQQFFYKKYNPLISVVIPVYNAESKIKKAIRSIQNQNISNLEIILVNDYSNDKTIDIIQNLQNDDKRITLIENKENKGILYTRCIGTLMAKGKYIFPLDNDDLFFDEGIINSIVNEAIKDKLDIVEFNYDEFHELHIPQINL